MKQNKGFTLVELLVVIFIISILTGIGLVSFSGAQKQARDTTRRSDLGQYRNALENYAANNDGLYPLKASAGATTLQVCNESLSSFIASCPIDPNPANASWVYSYMSAADKTSYIIYSKLEIGGYWYLCSSGVNGKSVDAPLLAVCSATAPEPTPTPAP